MLSHTDPIAAPVDSASLEVDTASLYSAVVHIVVDLYMMGTSGSMHDEYIVVDMGTIQSTCDTHTHTVRKEDRSQFF